MRTEQLLCFYGWSKEPDIEECAKKAYLDMARTMNYKKGNDIKSEKNQYKQNIYKLIMTEISNLLNKSKITRNDFEQWHQETCCLIIRNSIECNLIEEFHYGHAQKWLNMTFKYMIMAEVEAANAYQKIENLKSFLHVPIDQFMMQVISRVYNIKLPMKTNKEDTHEYGKYCYKITRGKNKGNFAYNPGDRFKCWSKWDSIEYRKIQDELKKKLFESGIECPLEWEFKVWIDERDKKSSTQSNEI